jgi:hypothetical protein
MGSHMLTGFQYRAALASSNITVKNLSRMLGLHEITLLRYKKTPNLEYVKCHNANMRIVSEFFRNNRIIFHKKNSIQLKVSINSTDITRFHIVVARIAAGLNQKQLSDILQISAGTISLLESKDNTEIVKTRTFRNRYLVNFFNHIGVNFGYDYTVILNKNPQKILQTLKC